LDDKRTARWLLADRLREQAEHLSEIEMRTSLSRMYYAAFHAAVDLTGITDHGNIPVALDKIETGLGKRYDRLRQLRSKADYAPSFAEDSVTDLPSFQSLFREEMTKAGTLYDRLSQLAGESLG
jgi:uncharacterized protein (UPF0332 family)